MRIAQVCPRYHPDIGGVETHVKDIGERLVKRGFEVEVICTDSTGRLPKHEMINGVKVTRFRSIAPHDAYFFAPQIYNYLKNQDYDVIHAHNYHAFPALFAAMAKKNRQFVFSPYYHGNGHTFFRNLLHRPYKLLGSKIFERADKVVCISQHEMDLVREHFNVSESKMAYIPSGLNLRGFENIESIERDHKTILFVGRLEKYKGVQYIIQVLPLLEDCRLDIIGTGPYEQELKKLASNLGVSERIDWIKELSRAKLLQHYKSADVFIILSEHEAYGIVVAEALASGTPCIVAKAGALSEFIDGEICMGVTLPISSNELAEMIERAASVKRVKYDRNLMDWDEVVKRLIEVYER